MVAQAAIGTPHPVSRKESILKANTKYSLTAAAVLASGLMLSANVRADDANMNNVGPYVSLGAGVTMPEGADARVLGPNPFLGPPVTNNPAHFSWGTGYNIVAATGWKTSSGFRPEIEFGWRSTDLHRVNGISWSGKEDIFGVMGNLLYDFNTHSSFTPYIGGGVGAARNRFENVSGPSAVFTPSVYTGHDTNFQWQLIGGVSTQVSSHVALFAEYRYIRLDDNRIGSRSNPTSAVVGYDDKSHNIIAGVRISFGGPEEQHTRTEASYTAPPPPPPPPAATAPVAPPPVPQKTLAFFDFDKSNLREDARQIVRAAADFARTNNKTIIHVTGHTDTSGSVEYNLGLSKRRAVAVKAELVRLGIPADEITVAWKGKSEPLVQTGDGVKEPQNRRVEIIYE